MNIGARAPLNANVRQHPMAMATAQHLAAPKTVGRAIPVLLLLGGIGSAFKCIWFFGFFSYNVGSSSPLVALALYLPIVVAPYILLWAAYRRSRSVRLNYAILVVTTLCVATSAIYYIDGLPRVQDGEFGIVFGLAIPQLVFAIACFGITLWHRRGHVH